MPQYENVQVIEDLSVGGTTDLGQTNTGALSIGSGYITFSGAVVESKEGFMLTPMDPPTASSQGAILFFDADTRQVGVVLPIVDGGGTVYLT